MKILLRSTIGLISVILALDALLLIIRGVFLTYEAIHNLLMHPGMARPLLPSLEAIDLFFMAIAFLILAMGLVQLFLSDLPFVRRMSMSWLHIESFGQLKLLLWDTFLVTLLVSFITQLASTDTIGWDLLVLPVAISMLALGSFLLKLKH
jgi:uncharacterized membrane protein YqhA